MKETRKRMEALVSRFGAGLEGDDLRYRMRDVFGVMRFLFMAYTEYDDWSFDEELDRNREDKASIKGTPSRSLSYLTQKEFVSVLLGLAKKSLKTLEKSTSKTPFMMGQPEEMVFSEVLEIEDELERDDVCFEYKTWSRLPLEFEFLYKYDPWESSREEYASGCVEGEDLFFEHLDGVDFLKIFYPHAGTELTDELAQQNPTRLAMELESAVGYFERLMPPEGDVKYFFQMVWDYQDEKQEKKEEKIRAQKAQPKPNKDTKPSAPQKSLYLMKDNDLGFYKIGVSNNPKHREKTLMAQKPSVEMVGSWSDLGNHERDWHKHFEKERVRGEWFKLTPAQVRFFVHRCQRKDGPIAFATAW